MIQHQPPEQQQQEIKLVERNDRSMICLYVEAITTTRNKKAVENIKSQNILVDYVGGAIILETTRFSSSFCTTVC
jgi:hypothetical protein